MKTSRERAQKAFAHRLNAAMETLGIRQIDLAEKLGTTPPTVNRWVNAKTIPEGATGNFLAQVLGVSTEWLMQGKGSEHAKTAPQPPPKPPRYVPLLSWAQAGQYRIGHTDEAYDHTAVLALDVEDGQAFAVEIEGDSMSPQLQPGDRVIVAPSWKPRAGDTVIARTVEGDVFCKLYTRSSGGKLVLVSVNANHPPIELSPEEIAWIYPVAQVTKNLRRR